MCPSYMDSLITMGERLCLECALIFQHSLPANPKGFKRHHDTLKAFRKAAFVDKCYICIRSRSHMGDSLRFLEEENDIFNDLIIGMCTTIAISSSESSPLSGESKISPTIDWDIDLLETNYKWFQIEFIIISSQCMNRSSLSCFVYSNSRVKVLRPPEFLKSCDYQSQSPQMIASAQFRIGFLSAHISMRIWQWTISAHVSICPGPPCTLRRSWEYLETSAEDRRIYGG